jgi:predicted CXXCH cytochrome family protein
MNKMAIVLVLLSTTLWTVADSGLSPAKPTDRGDGNIIADHNRGIAGGPHDFSQSGGNPCSACHIPHVQAMRATTSRPSSQPAVEMYRIAGQRKVFVPGRYTPGPASLICLGCHDGTVAMSTIGSSHSMLAGVREGFAMPEGLVWRDHPIGIKFPVDRREFRAQAFVERQGMRLPEGRVECISCHDPHNVAGVKHMLWQSNRRSALCLSCHIK